MTMTYYDRCSNLIMEWYDQIICDFNHDYKNLVSYDYNIMNIWLVIMKITKWSKYMGRLSKLS
jgi:hypothetical protein